MDDIEIVLLTGLLKDMDFFTKSVMYFKERQFIQESNKIIFVALCNHYSEYSVAPNYTTLYYDAINSKHSSKQSISETEEALKTIKSCEVPNTEWLLENAESFIQQREMRQAILKASQIYEENDNAAIRNEIPKIINGAVTAGFDSKVGQDWILDAESRLEHYLSPESRVLSGIAPLDDATCGGVKKKTLNLLMASTNVGKSLSLCALASAYSSQGHDVLYVSLEMSEEEILMRVDANKLGIDLGEFANIDRKRYLNKIMELRGKSHGKIIAKEYPPKAASAAHIRKLVKDIKIKYRLKPSVLIVDYLGLCTSTKSKAMEDHAALKAVSEELRAVAVDEDLIVWSAVQTNRGAASSTSVGVEDVAESYGITMTADFMLALMRTPALDKQGIMLASVVKTRYGNNKDKKYQFGIDINQQRIFSPDGNKYDKKSLEENKSMRDTKKEVVSAQRARVNSARDRFKGIT